MQNKVENTPSNEALSAAKEIWPRGQSNMTYCWESEEVNEYKRQEYRDYQAQIIDKHFALIIKEHAALNAVAEAAEHADCGCTVKERYSGHRSGCAMESIHEALATLKSIRKGDSK